MNTIKIIILATFALISELSAASFDSYFKKDVCDQVIDKKVFTICYDYNYKAAKAVGYTLYGDKVGKSIENDLSFTLSHLFGLRIEQNIVIILIAVTIAAILQTMQISIIHQQP